MSREVARILSAHQVQTVDQNTASTEAIVEGLRFRRRRCWPTVLAQTLRAGAWPQRAGRVHALARLQLRRRHPVSEKLVKEDYYTSIHIEEFEIEARDTKLGPEEITRDIRTSPTRSCAIWTRAASSGSAPR